jgi:hypothetical protein
MCGYLPFLLERILKENKVTATLHKYCKSKIYKTKVYAATLFRVLSSYLNRMVSIVNQSSNLYYL